MYSESLQELITRVSSDETWRIGYTRISMLYIRIVEFHFVILVTKTNWCKATSIKEMVNRRKYAKTTDEWNNRDLE